MWERDQEVDHEIKLDKTDMSMIRCICGFSQVIKKEKIMQS